MMDDARARRSRAALLAAMLDLLETTPFDQLTVQQIADRAGAGRTTFFRHFSGKDALLDEVAAGEIDALVARSLPLFDRGDVHAAALALCVYVREHWLLWKALLSGGAASILRGRYLERSKIVAHGRVRESAWLPPEVGLVLSTSSVVELLTWWLRQDAPPGPEAVAAMISNVILPAFALPGEAASRQRSAA